MMGEMKETLNEVEQTLRKFSQLTPDQVKEFQDLMEAIEKKGALDPKQKELIAIALSVGVQCKWCIAFHVQRALKEGATKEEILEATWVAVLMGGGPALMYSQLVLKALEEF
ncbi:MAG: carboxymuconolactone decarboxylase family protein [Candidatus Aerophobetes bacterium]|nr:carboxymuconolactone decarboxylase family protein [Candidatus Aerophobetes bacterium]